MTKSQVWTLHKDNSQAALLKKYSKDTGAAKIEHELVDRSTTRTVDNHLMTTLTA
jgi:hypothetical protein